MKKFFAVRMLMCIALLSSNCVYSQSPQSGKGVILPQPMSIVQKTGELTLGKTLSVGGNVPQALISYMDKEFASNFRQSVRKTSTGRVNIIFDIQSSADSSDESYTLDIDPVGVKITAASQSGAFYAIQSLMQLMRAGKDQQVINVNIPKKVNLNTAKGIKALSDALDNAQKAADELPVVIKIQAQTITDAPRFSWRAYMLDEGRYFRGEEQVLMLLDAMASLKMNVFHWHLTDDQGWRIESKKYPLLTEVGSKRKTSQLGGFSSEKYSGTPHEGFYTQEQVKRIVKYANDRHIKVVPEIEMPGHASAAIAAYPWLGSSDEKIEVPGKFGKHFATFNVTDPRVVEFLKDIVSEMIPLFGSDVIHIGGDEVKFEHWKTNPKIVQYCADKGYGSPMDLQIAFTNDMSRFIEGKGLSMMGWNEIMGKNLHGGEIQFADPAEKVASNVIVQFWKGDPKDIAVAAADGYRVVNSYHTYTYLDYSFPLSQAYAFDPIPQGLDAKYHKNIIGAGCQMWGEWLTDHKKMQVKTFPRIAAYAEVGWSPAQGKDFADFTRRLDPFVKEWQRKGIEVGEVK